MVKNSDPWILCDIDGTISDGNHRQHLLDNAERAENIDWDEYHQLSIYDPPIQPMIDLVNHLGKISNIAFLTARPVKWQAVTQQWLNTHVEVPYELYMRKENDLRLASEVKKERVEKSFCAPRRVWMALEDHLPVVRMYREMGIICLQPRERNV